MFNYFKKKKTLKIDIYDCHLKNYIIEFIESLRKNGIEHVSF